MVTLAGKYFGEGLQQTAYTDAENVSSVGGLSGGLTTTAIDVTGMSKVGVFVELTQVEATEVVMEIQVAYEESPTKWYTLSNGQTFSKTVSASVNWGWTVKDFCARHMRFVFSATFGGTPEDDTVNVYAGSLAE